MVLFYTALDETRKTQNIHNNFKLIDIKVGLRDEFYIKKWSYATNIVICNIICEKYVQVTFTATQITSNMLLFYTALDESGKTQMTHNDIKLMDIKVEQRDELYIHKLSYTTNIVICYKLRIGHNLYIPNFK